jgi:thiamine monophosphate kinase
LVQEKFPVSDELREAAGILNKEPRDFFLGDSDDYQLIITCGAKDVERIRSSIALTYEGPVTEVGQVTALEKGLRLLLPDGSEQTLSAKGWNHFR